MPWRVGTSCGCNLKPASTQHHGCQSSHPISDILLSALILSSPAMVSKLLVAFLVWFLAGALPDAVDAQNCGCDIGQCCSQWRYCGTGDDYCGNGCLEGPCYLSGGGGGGGDGGVSLSDVVTEDFFNVIFGQDDGSCDGRNFYSRSAFLDAAGSYSQFPQNGSTNDSKREIAAFFAHVTHETGHFCHIEEVGGASKDYCQEDNEDYKCVDKKGYYGRGPIQISWNYNYGPAEESIWFDVLNNPEIVADDLFVSFKTALWFWTDRVQSVLGQGFGATIQAVNGKECEGGNRDAVSARVRYYTNYCNQFGVSPGDNLYC